MLFFLQLMNNHVTTIDCYTILVHSFGRDTQMMLSLTVAPAIIPLMSVNVIFIHRRHLIYHNMFLHMIILITSCSQHSDLF